MRLDLLTHTALAISNLRAAEIGGCFRPGTVPQGECSDGDCYCYRQCEREARTAMTAVADALDAYYGDRHPGVVAIRAALSSSSAAIPTDAPAGRDGWRTMNSAPRDRNILLYGPSPDGPRVTEGFWCDDPYLLSNEDGSDVAEPYWMSMDGGFTAEHPPTAWQPKPVPPIALSQHGEGR